MLLRLIALAMIGICGYLTAEVYFFPKPPLSPAELSLVEGHVVCAEYTSAARIPTTLKIQVEGYEHMLKNFSEHSLPKGQPESWMDLLATGNPIELLVRSTELNNPRRPLLGEKFVPFYSITADGVPLLTLDEFNTARAKDNFLGKFVGPLLLLCGLFLGFVAFVPLRQTPQQQRRKRTH